MPKPTRRERKLDIVARIEIPLGARIIAVCDSFDAMLSSRPYSPPRAVADALTELRRCAGTQFEPDIVTIFEQVLSNREELRDSGLGRARDGRASGRDGRIGDGGNVFRVDR